MSRLSLEADSYFEPWELIFRILKYFIVFLQLSFCYCNSATSGLIRLETWKEQRYLNQPGMKYFCTRITFVFIQFLAFHTRPQKRIRKYPFLSPGYARSFFIYTVQIKKGNLQVQASSQSRTFANGLFCFYIVTLQYLRKHACNLRVCQLLNQAFLLMFLLMFLFIKSRLLFFCINSFMNSLKNLWKEFTKKCAEYLRF